MAAIRPFRHWLVYPALMRRLDTEWQRRLRAASSAQTPSPAPVPATGPVS